jgi:hypothetical protein
MYLFHIFRSFLPLHNPIGFGPADFIEIALAGLLVVLVLAHARVEALARKLAVRTVWCMLALAGLAVVLRLALLPAAPVPAPRGADDFSYLLLSDTLAHFRLANPTHPLHQFFEWNFVLQQPAYSSIYPIGPALALAFGQIVFHSPWAGVLLATGLFCALCYWMLRGWTTPGWALAGGFLAVCEFGPLCYWTNCYWGGAVSACAGCLAFGALPRLRDHRRIRDAVALGLGVGLQMISRPYESVILDLAVALFLLPSVRGIAKLIAVAALAVLPAVALLALHNHAVTGNWTSLPYQLSRYQHGVPTTLTFQTDPVPHDRLNIDQRIYYEGQKAVHDSTPGFFARLADRLPFTRFFLLPPLYLAIPFFVLLLGQPRFAWVALTLALFVIGSNFYPYFFPHYVAAAACLVQLAAVAGLERLSRFSERAARWMVLLCAAHFLFWYGLHAVGNEQMLDAIGQYDFWDVIPHGDPEHRLAIDAQLDSAPGRQLVFVRYWPEHGYHEWIHNGADIDGQRVILALDLGPDENEELIRYYPRRTVWLLEPDAIPPSLTPYVEPPETPPVVASPPAPASNDANHGIVLEQVR